MKRSEKKAMWERKKEIRQKRKKKDKGINKETKKDVK